MLRFIWDKVRKILPAACFVSACGAPCFFIMKHAGEDEAALVGLATIFIGVGLVGYMVFCGLRDALRLRDNFTLDETMDEFQDAWRIHPNLRIGDKHLFFNTVTLAYPDIRGMYCTYEPVAHLNGETSWWFILYALDADDKKRRMLLIKEIDPAGTKAEATRLFTQVMDVVAGKNPEAELRYPDYK